MATRSAIEGISYAGSGADAEHVSEDTPVTYAAGFWEQVDWSGFGIVKLASDLSSGSSERHSTRWPVGTHPEVTAG